MTTTTEPVASTSTTDDTSQTTTESTTTTTTEEPDSVLGATGHFVWTVVSFPFRLIGDAISLLV